MGPKSGRYNSFKCLILHFINNEITFFRLNVCVYTYYVPKYQAGIYGYIHIDTYLSIYVYVCIQSNYKFLMHHKTKIKIGCLGCFFVSDK